MRKVGIRSWKFNACTSTNSLALLLKVIPKPRKLKRDLKLRDRSTSADIQNIIWLKRRILIVHSMLLNYSEEMTEAEIEHLGRILLSILRRSFLLSSIKSWRIDYLLHSLKSIHHCHGEC
jgi:hypothetical protein